MSDRKDKPTLRNSIEENLRKVYQDMLQEEVPDRFQQLLAQLKDATGPSGGKPKEGGDGEDAK